MKKQPAIYITHGAGPCFWADFPAPFGPHAFDGLKQYFTDLLGTLPAHPKAILMVSAHWEASRPTVNTGAAPGMLYDYYGFPEHTYSLRYPAPGDPTLAGEVKALLEDAGLDVVADPERDFDHGVFVPMMVIDADARIPVVMLSLQRDLDPALHIRMGEAIASLRSKGVLVIGSGSSYHNLHRFRDGQSQPSRMFDDWLNETLCQTDPDTRKARLIEWKAAPGALDCHPREEHLLPLMVALGAAGAEPGRRSFHEMIGGKLFSCFTFGS